VGTFAWYSAHREKRRRLNAVCWNLSLAYLCFAIAFFISRTLLEFI